MKYISSYVVARRHDQLHQWDIVEGFEVMESSQDSMWLLLLPMEFNYHTMNSLYDMILRHFNHNKPWTIIYGSPLGCAPSGGTIIRLFDIIDDSPTLNVKYVFDSIIANDNVRISAYEEIRKLSYTSLDRFVTFNIDADNVFGMCHGRELLRLSVESDLDKLNDPTDIVTFKYLVENEDFGAQGLRLVTHMDNVRVVMPDMITRATVAYLRTVIMKFVWQEKTISGYTPTPRIVKANELGLSVLGMLDIQTVYNKSIKYTVPNIYDRIDARLLFKHAAV